MSKVYHRAHISHALKARILHLTDAQQIERCDLLQTLWGGYGQILRVQQDGEPASLIVKQLAFPAPDDSLAHQRKVYSYQVERHWYQHWAARCTEACRVAACYGVCDDALLLQDLDVAGFNQRKSRLGFDEVMRCLSWLAHFHARFMGVAPPGLWPVGCYWHLATRPDEWQVLSHQPLKQAAVHLDAQLQQCRYLTLVHGDAKSDNFCFHQDGQQVAAVDFQYVGAGCGMKDVAYLLDSALSDADCWRWADDLLDGYFAELQRALVQYQCEVDWSLLQQQWRVLYPVAWADFYRFVLGWQHGAQPIGRYAAAMIKQAVG